MASRWAHSSIAYLALARERGNAWRGMGVAPRVPCADRPPSLHLVRCAGSLHTAQLENVTSLERFPRALPGPQPPRRLPSAYFPSPVPQPPGAWGARPGGGSASGARCPRVRPGQVGAPPGPIPPASRPGHGPLTCAAPGAAEDAIPSCRGCSGRHRAARAARGAGCPWPAPPRAAPRRRTARPAGGGGPLRPPGLHLAPRGAPAGCRLAAPPLARPGPAAGRGPRSSLARPPGASRLLRPAEWPALLAAGAAEGRREAGSARISINLGPRRSVPPAPSPPPAPRPSSGLTPEGPPESKRLRQEQPWSGGAQAVAPREVPQYMRPLLSSDPWGRPEHGAF